MRDIPNLNGVRAFEAAARHGGFKAAAEELGVTPAAVSRHIRNLERTLGVALFERHARHVTLTAEGGRFAVTASEALSSLALASRGLRGARGGERVVVDVDSEVMLTWLAPRLDEAALKDMGVQLDLRARPDPPRLALGEADLAITWGAQTSNGFKSELFLDYAAFPVAAPALDPPRGEDAETLAAFLRDQRLLHDRGLYWWRRACTALGMRAEEARDHVFLNRSYLCLDAAERGLGVAIGDDMTYWESLKAGRLLRLAAPTLKSRERHYLLTPDNRPTAPPVRRVVDWLRAQAEAHRKAVAAASPFETGARARPSG
ncbi:MAG: LysR family transcriptional regulator [Alphaproteobacteria bacterium]|nr:LysR family transcriptional regulator [Alphaproteobacteria bacterium]